MKEKQKIQQLEKEIQILRDTLKNNLDLEEDRFHILRDEIKIGNHYNLEQESDIMVTLQLVKWVAIALVIILGLYFMKSIL